MDGIDKWMPTVQQIMQDLATQWPAVAEIIKKAVGDIGANLQGVDVKAHVADIIEQLKPLSQAVREINLPGTVQEIQRKLAPLASSVKDLEITRTGGMATATIGGREAAQIFVKAPAVPPAQFPDKVILRVGDREFTAYVDERADALLGQAAALLSRGRK
jgi:hypothetical protein